MALKMWKCEILANIFNWNIFNENWQLELFGKITQLLLFTWGVCVAIIPSKKGF